MIMRRYNQELLGAPFRTRESHRGDLVIQRYDQSDWRVGLLQCLYSLKGARQVKGQGRLRNVATKEAKENRIGASPVTRWRRPCMRVVVCLSIDQGEHRGVEAVGRKGRGSDDESRGAVTQNQSVGQKGGGLGGVPQCRRGGPTDHKERDANARQQIVGPWAGSTMVPQSEAALPRLLGVASYLSDPPRVENFIVRWYVDTIAFSPLRVGCLMIAL
ncbi:hypothetical protein BHM03_00059671 [Ensete ventricosum]|nr:hypothetical protein BHM03_00059671 [Ensete ventricosum]